MTVETLASRQRYLGDGASSQFDFTFPYADNADIRLIQKVGGVETALIEGAQYSLTRVGAGGRINLGGALVNNGVLAVLRDPAPIQGVDLTSNDRYFLETIEAQFDRQAMVLQRHRDLLTRSIVLAETDVDGSGAYQARGNRIGGLAAGVNASDAVTVAQLAAVAGGDLLVTPGTIAAVTALVITDPSLLALFGPINSQIGSLVDDIADLDAALAALSQIAGDPNNIITLITTETTNRIAGDTALAQTVAKLGALSGDSLAFILNLNTAKVSSTESLAQRLDGIASRFNSNEAAILSEQTARANGDGALAASISTVQSTLGANTATVQTLQSSVNGVLAKYAVKIDNNGYITGFGLLSGPNNGSIVSAFVVLADQFRVVTPGATPQSPFEIIGGIVYAKNLVVRNAQIENLTITKLTGGTLNGDMAMGTGRIIWNTGAVMKVSGLGFGSANQFIEWVGPAVGSLSLCTEANATSYLKVDGSAYFGGTLSAGVLKSSATTSSTSVAAEIINGPYGSNGGTIQVILSYIFTGTRSFAEAGFNSGSGPISATVQLYRKIGAGSETLVATLNVAGLWTWEKEEGTRYETEQMGGSLTYTDTAATAQDRTYRAVITARSVVFTSGTISQRVTIQSTE
jgi:hypothetical protein